MKILHTADLHIGKSVNGFSMIEDQKHILNEILRIIAEERPSALVVAGDVYDKPLPSAEAVTLFDNFLSALTVPAFIVSGNHDSSERLAFGGRLMSPAGIHISPVYSGKIEPVIIEAEGEKAAFWLVPFLKPAVVRRRLEREELSTYAEAMEAVLDTLDINGELINIGVLHQFFTGAEKSGSEEISVGGLDDIPRSLLSCFDYAALGHIHRPQRVGENAAYSGSVLKYSFSEADGEKSVRLVDVSKGGVKYTEIPLAPLRDMRIIKGKYDSLLLRESYENTNTADYIRAVLTDEDEIPDAIGRMRAVYPNIMEIIYDNTRTRENRSAAVSAREGQYPAEIFAELFELQNNREMTELQQKILSEEIERIWEGEE